jgi:very-short-patch-repair endonuclease
MAGRKQQSVDGVWALADMQHGVVARRQLREMGFSGKAIEHRLVRGRLHPVEWEVFAVGRPQLDTRGRWMAAVLSCGPTAALSHWSAGALWGIADEKHEIEVSVRTCTRRGRRGSGVRLHRRECLCSEELACHEGIPVTRPTRTLVDLAALAGPAGIERLVNEADRLNLVNPESLSASLGSYRGQRGVARLREALDSRTFRLTDSELERRFLRLAREARLPVPETGSRLNGFKVDFHWPDMGLVVETDGLRYHRTPAQQARDRERDQAHVAAGLTALRFTHAQVFHEPERVRQTLRTVAHRLLERPAA